MIKSNTVTDYAKRVTVNSRLPVGTRLNNVLSQGSRNQDLLGLRRPKRKLYAEPFHIGRMHIKNCDLISDVYWYVSDMSFGLG